MTLMATTSIWRVKGWLGKVVVYVENPDKTTNPKFFTDKDMAEQDGQELSDVIRYAVNSRKTQKADNEDCAVVHRFASGINCSPATARDDMLAVKKRFGKEDGTVAYHGYQSFAPGEATPEMAHEIGMKLAARLWGDRYQVIVATHLDKENHLHNHFVLNTVSFVDGIKYHRTKKDYHDMQTVSDELCREYALSVIEHPSGRKKPYALYQAEKQGLPTRDNVARQAVDEAISKSFTLKDFDRLMAEMGYKCSFDPNRKYWTIIGKGWQRPKRLYKLGEEYTNERIMERITENSYAVKFSRFTEPQRTVKVFRVKGSLTGAKKIGGLRGLYLHYCYKLGILPKNKKQNYARLHYLLKDDLMKMEAITQETRLLCRNRIDTVEQLLSYKGSLETEKTDLLQKRKELYSISRKTGGEEKEAIRSQLSDLSKRLSVIRKEVRLCESIEARNATLKEKLSTIRADEEQQRKELMTNEYKRRSGRTNRPNELGRI